MTILFCYRNHQEPVSTAVAASAPNCALSQWQFFLFVVTIKNLSLHSCGSFRSQPLVHLKKQFFLVAGTIKNLSPQLWQLQHLTALYLNDNSLFRIPSSIALLQNLRQVDFLMNLLVLLHLLVQCSHLVGSSPFFRIPFCSFGCNQSFIF